MSKTVILFLYLAPLSLVKQFFSLFFFLTWRASCPFNFFGGALSLHCCLQAFSGCGEQGLLFVVVHKLLIEVASPVVEHKL